ncbi:MAG: hypothetical protein IIA23_07240 [Chloroflexi bacterium]|nr:hypothetical protein [Chloroflexota bacterium]
MRIDWRIAAGLMVIVGAVLGSALAISLVQRSNADDTARYEVTVQFNTTVTQDDLDEAGALLRTYDNDLEFLIMEIFPPIGRAVVTTEAADFCQTVETELGAKSYVDDVSCGPHVETDQADPDAPVSTDNDPNS